MVENYGITILYTAPTAIRGLMRFGDAWANRHDLSSLRLLGSVGEPINPEAWKWYYTVIGRRTLPDHGYLVADRDRRLYDLARCRSRRSNPARPPGRSSASMWMWSTKRASRCRQARRAIW